MKHDKNESEVMDMVTPNEVPSFYTITTQQYNKHH